MKQKGRSVRSYPIYQNVLCALPYGPKQFLLGLVVGILSCLCFFQGISSRPWGTPGCLGSDHWPLPFSAIQLVCLVYGVVAQVVVAC